MSAWLPPAVAIWFVFVVLAIVNGGVREKWLISAFGPVRAQVISGISLSTLVLFFAWLLLPFLGELTASQYWLVGGLWAVMTVAFEFLFGHYVRGLPWTRLFEAYDVTRGNLWWFVLVVTALSPFIAAKLRGFV